jgi:hypothetical protein
VLYHQIVTLSQIIMSTGVDLIWGEVQDDVHKIFIPIQVNVYMNNDKVLRFLIMACWYVHFNDTIANL